MKLNFDKFGFAGDLKYCNTTVQNTEAVKIIQKNTTNLLFNV